MKQLFIALIGASALVLSGCQTTKETEVKAVTAPKPSLSVEATQALAKAEADVKAAKAQNALWTTADDAFKKAKEAAAKFDSETVLKLSKTASDQAQLGIQQTKYPVSGF